MSLYKSFVRPLLFSLDAEKAHTLSFRLIKNTLKVPGITTLARTRYCLNPPELEREVFGLKFKNPVGLAAGFDKNAELIDELDGFGFGFIEIGTVTPRPQVGNPQPRLFRLLPDQAIINRMGFNNHGLEKVIEKLKKRKLDTILGGNIGKNKDTPNERALDDYVLGFQALFEYVDYFVVNVSSPNTPNLRALQAKDELEKILGTLQEKNQGQKNPKPILLKIAPDLNEGQLDEIIEVVLATKTAGVIATNTTISRANLQSSSSEIEKIGAGGLSGLPLRDRSTEVIRYLHQQSSGAFPIIGVGGVASPESALEKLAAGASLIQLYTGFIYEGPRLIKQIKEALLSNQVMA